MSISHSQISFTQIILNTSIPYLPISTSSESNSTDIHIRLPIWFIDLYTDILLLPNSIDIHTDLCQTQPTYISDIPTGLCTYIPTLAINMPPKLPNSADTPTKLNTTTDVELNNCSQSTYLPRYQTQLIHLNYTHQPV